MILIEMLLTNKYFIRLNSVSKFWCDNSISRNDINHIFVPFFVEIVFVWIRQAKKTYFFLVPTRSTIINPHKLHQAFLIVITWVLPTEY